MRDIIAATMELSAVTNLKAFDSAPKKGRSKSITYGAWKLVRTEDKRVEVYKNGVLCAKSKPALRELAEEIGFEYHPDWTTRQFGNKVLEALTKK